MSFVNSVPSFFPLSVWRFLCSCSSVPVTVICFGGGWFTMSYVCARGLRVVLEEGGAAAVLIWC
jgi:hypothetical protein